MATIVAIPSCGSGIFQNVVRRRKNGSQIRKEGRRLKVKIGKMPLNFFPIWKNDITTGSFLQED